MRSLTRRGRVLSAATVAVLTSAALIAASATGAQGRSSVQAAPAVKSGITLNGVKDVTALLKGIPQAGAWLGNESAPIQLVVFADLQCPFCKKFDRDVMPTVVKEYVRTGKIRVFFAGMDFVGPDSVRGLKAVAAAADQNRLWHVVQLLYANQGEENKGWLSEKLVAAVAKATPGLDARKLDTARKGKVVESRMATWQQLSSSAGVNSTPTFFAGTKGKLGRLAVTALEIGQFRKALNTLINAK